jgi:stage II sporulation protein D
VRLRGGIVLLCALAAVAAAGTASAASVLVVSGRGWGHGVGMSQWGAYGYARHGWSYDRILAHYYPGTRLETVSPERRVRVLLAADRASVGIGCAARMSVADATGMGHPLAAGTYGIGPRLVLPVGRRRVRGTHRHTARPVYRTVSRRLRSPLVVRCDRAPLVVDGHPYHGLVVVRSNGRRLAVVNSLPLDEYVRGVVGGEMPSRWSPAALEAQAVAARSYALATLQPGRAFDLRADTRDQVYGGIAYEGPRTDLAVARTAGRVLTWRGHVALTYYSSSSGGRTADVRDLGSGRPAVPYLRPVSDPYDALSPHHTWGPVVLAPRRVAAKLGLPEPVASLRLERSASERVAALDVVLASGATRRVAGDRFRRLLGLRSTWFGVGELAISSSRATVRYGRTLRLSARTHGLGAALLQRRTGAGRWQTILRVRSGARVAVQPEGRTLYRLSVDGIRGPEVAVGVAPRVRVQPLARTLLGGTVLPRTSGEVAVWRRVAGSWRLVARPRLDPHGVFRAPVRLRPGAYRVTIGADARLAATETRLRVTKRLLATFHG